MMENANDGKEVMMTMEASGDGMSIDGKAMIPMPTDDDDGTREW